MRIALLALALFACNSAMPSADASTIVDAAADAAVGRCALAGSWISTPDGGPYYSWRATFASNGTGTAWWGPMGTTITWSLSGSTLTLNGSTYALAFDDACGTFVASAMGVADCTFQLACGDVYAKQ